MNATTCWDRWLHWKHFAEWLYHYYISSLFLSQHNSLISTSPLLIAIFSHDYFPPPHWWVRSLVWMYDYIGSTLLICHIIVIFLYIIIPLIGWIVWYHIYQWLSFHCNGVVSPLLLFIVLFCFIVSYKTLVRSKLPRHVYSDYIPAQWNQYFIRVPCLINNVAWHYLAFSFPSNDAISSSPCFIVVFFHHSMFYPRVWLQPLIMITVFIWRTLLRYLTILLSSLFITIKR